jgi:tRNA pseudouridine13 synthase
VTIPGQPVGRMSVGGLRLEPLGRVDQPMRGELLAGNRFGILLRDLPDAAAAGLVRRRAGFAARAGVPNYFDEQRFGSLRRGEGFIAGRLMAGDFEGALRLHLAAPSRLDSPRERERRQALDGLWGRWDEAFAALPRGSDRDAVGLLRAHPGDFAGAFELIDRRLAQLYLFAFQSYLWNEILARLLARQLPAAGLFRLKYAAGELVFFDSADDAALAEFRNLLIPLPARKAEYRPGPLADAASEALAAAGVALEDLHLKGLKHLSFRGGERPALVVPGEMKTGADEADEFYAGRRKLRLEFTLPPGSYATLVVKYVGREMLSGSRASRRRGKKRRKEGA